MTTTTRERINTLKDIIRHPYAWPGGYEKIALMNDGGGVCSHCCKEEYPNILHSTKYQYADGWEVIGVFLDCEVDECVCDHCGRDTVKYSIGEWQKLNQES